MAYCGYVTILKDVRAHPNANRLQLATVFGNTVCVDLSFHEGDLGAYFPIDGQLSEEFCEVNNLVRKKNEAGVNVGGYLDPDKRNVKAIRLRGEKSDGIFLPLNCVKYTGVDLTTLKAGDTITVLNGHSICTKYIPRRNHSSSRNTPKKNKIDKTPIAPLFQEHVDTEQLVYHLDEFKLGDEIEITLKIHGTSQRTGYLPVLKGFKKTWLDKILRRPGKPIYDWDYVTGTRRTVLDDYDGGFYGSNAFREQHAKAFEGKLWKGETIYYEICGFTDTDVPIMASASNKKTNDKEFIKQYGETTTFSYGCSPDGKNGPQSDFYVYRMTMTNEDGEVVEYTPDFMRYRCEQMGVKTVPVFAHGYIDSEGICAIGTDNYPYAYPHMGDCVGDTVKEIAEDFYDGPDPVGRTHIREGVVIRIINRPKFTAYKIKNFYFKLLSGIISEAVADGEVEVSEDIIEEL